ncbi:hypothetical protein EDB85DRAFT_265722 [Lactarius pseudohatsudake]|nr:hypothetical protein EDB85DRAFT_265722 [Lactarius pseudohatsudake]
MWDVLSSGSASAGTRGHKLHASPRGLCFLCSLVLGVVYIYDSRGGASHVNVVLLFWFAFSILAFLSDTLGPRAPPAGRRVHAVGAKLLHRLFPIHDRPRIQILPIRAHLPIHIHNDTHTPFPIPVPIMTIRTSFCSRPGGKADSWCK